MPVRAAAAAERRALDAVVPADPDNHRVPELMRLAHALDVAVPAELVCPSGVPLPPLGL